MQRTLRTLGLSTLALIASGATLQKPEPAARIVDAATGEPIRAQTIPSRSERVIRAPGYQDVRIVTSAGPGTKHLPRGPREVALCKLGASDRDGDGLCDAAEQRYRTLADDADTDGDAISDRIEIYGEALPDGSAFSPEAYGASPGHRDIFVYVNWTNRWPAKRPLLRFSPIAGCAARESRARSPRGPAARTTARAAYGGDPMRAGPSRTR